MCKKIGIAAIAVLAGLLVLNNTKLGSYCGFAWKKAKDKFAQAVPLEVEIDRLRYELTQLEPEIKKNRSDLAREMVALGELREDIAKNDNNLQKRYADLMAAKKEVDAGVQKVSYNGHKYDAKAAKELVANDWQSYTRAKEALQSRKKLAEAKEAQIAEARKQLAEWQSMREGLAAEIDTLEAEFKALQSAEERNNIRVDNTRLNRLKDSMADVRRAIKVRQTAIELQGDTAQGASSPIKTKAVEEAWKQMEDEEKSGKVAANE
jgi:chromosome segregation ATPase